MIKFPGFFGALLFVLIAPFQTLGFASEIPSMLTCTVNAHASRDFAFHDSVWTGPIPEFGKKPDPSQPFNIATKSTPDNIFRDKVFSGLNTKSPVVRSITPAAGGLKEEGVEFSATVVSRTDDAVFLIWNNPSGNKVWLAVVDLTHRKAIVNQAFQGITSVGFEADTLDCH